MNSKKKKFIFVIAFISIIIAIIGINIFITAQNTDVKDNERVITAKELLDSWRGQSSILKKAHSLISDALADNPNNVYAKKQLARYVLKKGYINSRWERNETYIYLVGNFKPGTLEQATSIINDALKIDPNFDEGYVLLAHIQFGQNKLREAESSLKKAELLGTDDPWLHLNWASLNIARGEYEAAIDRWNYVLQNYTGDEFAISKAYSFMLDHYKREGSQDNVVEVYRQMIKRESNNAWLKGNYASYLNEYMGRNDEAVEQARKALEIMNYGIGQKILANALYAKWADMVLEGNGNSAEQYFQEALQYYPYLDLVMAYSGSMPAGKNLAKALSTVKGVSINAKAEDGSTALLIATNRNRFETVKNLLELNADPNISDDNGWTPLLSAADEGNTEIVKLLLDNGADINVKLGRKDASTLAERRGETELAELLREHANSHK